MGEEDVKRFREYVRGLEEERDNEILKEITDFCRECPSNCNCAEEECVLYRIEKIVEGEEVC